MQLKELLEYEEVTIQTHDNPDADAIASGYALYKYFTSKGKKVSFFYSGRYEIQKTNLKLMISNLEIPISYVDPKVNDKFISGLLITVDCQHGAGNVQYFKADAIVVIDHHQKEINTSKLAYWCIDPNLGSCSTLVWELLLKENYPINEDINLGTALYYGLYRDTNQFSEISYPLDMDMRESVVYDRSIIQLLRNSNLSLQELEIAGIALIRSVYNSDYHYSIIRAGKCDPNLLGLISDFVIQVDEITTAVVFSELEDGYKFSVRSCAKDVRANELASFLAQDMGSGGGHIEKAGGFIRDSKFMIMYPNVHADAYFGNRIQEYFESYEVVEADNIELNSEDMCLYYKKDTNMGYAKVDSYFDIGSEVTLRTLDGDMDMVIEPDTYIYIDENGRVRSVSERLLLDKFVLSEEDCDIELDYKPRIKNKVTGEYRSLLDNMKSCTFKNGMKVYARELNRGIKLFTSNSDNQYMIGKTGDYLVINCEDNNKIYVVEHEIFIKTFELLG